MSLSDQNEPKSSRVERLQNLATATVFLGLSLVKVGTVATELVVAGSAASASADPVLTLYVVWAAIRLVHAVRHTKSDAREFAAAVKAFFS